MIKCHLKSRTGWVKTIDHYGPDQIISLPEARYGTGAQWGVSDRSPHQMDNATYVRMDFRLVMEAQLRDHRTNVVTTEAWYEEA